jgi:ABC-type lipoprotein export system ATPase subunit
MVLELQQLLPTYFSSTQVESSALWSKDIVISPGDFVEVVAPSGSGKTSLIHFLYGMRSDYTGRILFNQADLRDADHEKMAALRKDNLSVVFQDMRLFNDQTVRQNIELKRQLAPYHGADMINEMSSRLGIFEKLESTCGTCSYGEQQRVAIIRALMQPFNILLLDEPFSHLDTNNAEKAMKLIVEEATARNATIIFADLEKSPFYPYTKLFSL